MKKKLLFVIPEYSIGGTNTSLKNLLSFIDKNKYEISIYSLYEDGTDFFKNEFHPYIIKKSLLYHLAHDNKLTRKVMGLLMKLSQKVNFNWLYRYEANRIQRESEFDSVIAYQEGAASEFVSAIIMPVRKLSWMHGCYNEGVGRSSFFHDKKMYSKFDTIVCVSKASKESFLKVFPEFLNRCTFVYNLLDAEYILQKSQEPQEVSFDRECFNIVSVGRFCKMKNFGHIPHWAAGIKKRTSKPFCWYVIGDGEDFIHTMRDIEKYRVGNCVKLLGSKDNPYPYLSNADLHVCSSDFESFSYTIAESKLLHTPVLCNDFAVANEVVDANNGIIENKSSFVETISKLIDDCDGIYSNLKRNISDYKYRTDDIVAKLEKIL